MSFIQFFGSALQVTPHFHSLVPDGVFVPEEGGVRFAPLPPPTQGEVERLLKVVRHRVLRLLEKRGAHDRQGLERLCRYGARGALALERLSRAEDGRIAYRMKRPLPDGTTHLLFTGLELLRRLASLVPPPRANLTRFHGVFAPGSKLRPFLVPQAGEEGASEAPEAALSKEPKKKRTPRVDFRATAEEDVRRGRLHLCRVWRQAPHSAYTLPGRVGAKVPFPSPR